MSTAALCYRAYYPHFAEEASEASGGWATDPGTQLADDRAHFHVWALPRSRRWAERWAHEAAEPGVKARRLGLPGGTVDPGSVASGKPPALSALVSLAEESG